VREDLALTLEDLLRRRAAGSVTPFERIVIESSGLADPAPILHALMLDGGLSRQLTVAGVLTTVDAVNGLSTLERHAEAVKQVAVADRLLLTKTDLLAAPATDLLARLTALNPAAVLLAAAFGNVDADDLLGAAAADKAEAALQRALAAVAGHNWPAQHGHAAEIDCFAVVREAPIHAIGLTLLLEVLAEHCGGDLLRLKGVVKIAECPDRPAVIHGVQHVFHPPRWLERWPSGDRRSRLVFIGRRLRRTWIEALLRALEAEIAELGSG
jgi:G3E family GTPase